MVGDRVEGSVIVNDFLYNLLTMICFLKERTTLLPPSQRMLFCMLFREFRLLTRSAKPASWFSRTLRWFEEFFRDEDAGDLEHEVTDSMERVQGLYLAAQEGVQQSHKVKPLSISNHLS